MCIRDRDIDRFKADPDVKFGYITRSQDTDAQTRYFAAVNDTPEETYNDNDYMQPPDDTYDQNDIYEDTYDEDYTDFEEDEKPAKKSLFVPILSAVTVVVIMVAVFFIATLVKGVFSGDGQKSSSEFAMPNLCLLYTSY